MTVIEVRVRLLEKTNKKDRRIEVRRRYGSKKTLCSARDYYSLRNKVRKLNLSKKEQKTVLRKVKKALIAFNYRFFANWTPRIRNKHCDPTGCLPRAPDDFFGNLLWLFPADPGLAKLEEEGLQLLDARACVMGKLKEFIRLTALLSQHPHQPVAPRQVNWCRRKDASRVVRVALRQLLKVYSEVKLDGWSIAFLRGHEGRATRVFNDVVRCFLNERPEVFTWSTRRHYNKRVSQVDLNRAIALREWHLKKGHEVSFEHQRHRRRSYHYPKRPSRHRPQLFDALSFYLVGVVGWKAFHSFEEVHPGINAVYRSAMHPRILKRGDIKLHYSPDWGTFVEQRRGIFWKGTYKSPLTLSVVENFRPWIQVLVMDLIINKLADNKYKGRKLTFKSVKYSWVCKKLIKRLKYLDELRKIPLKIDTWLSVADNPEERTRTIDQSVNAIVVQIKGKTNDFSEYLRDNFYSLPVEETTDEISNPPPPEPFYRTKEEYLDLPGYKYYQQQLIEGNFDKYTLISTQEVTV